MTSCTEDNVIVSMIFENRCVLSNFEIDSTVRQISGMYKLQIKIPWHYLNLIVAENSQK